MPFAFRMLFPFWLFRLRQDKLKRLIAIQARIKLKRAVWHLMAKAFKCLLQAFQVLR